MRRNFGRCPIEITYVSYGDMAVQSLNFEAVWRRGKLVCISTFGGARSAFSSSIRMSKNIAGYIVGIWRKAQKTRFRAFENGRNFEWLYLNKETSYTHQNLIAGGQNWLKSTVKFSA